MADQQQVKDTSQLVLEAIKDSNPAVKFLVLKALLDELKPSQFERASVVENEDDEDGNGAWECPHCFKEYSGEDFTMIDVEWRAQSGSLDDDGEDRLWFDSEYATGHDDLALTCPNCDLPLTVPRGWEIDWN